MLLIGENINIIRINIKFVLFTNLICDLNNNQRTSRILLCRGSAYYVVNQLIGRPKVEKSFL